jgi:hypothetical protein
MPGFGRFGFRRGFGHDRIGAGVEILNTAFGMTIFLNDKRDYS